MEISSCEDEPAAMEYESPRQGRSAVVGQSKDGFIKLFIFNSS